MYPFKCYTKLSTIEKKSTILLRHHNFDMNFND